MNSTKNTSQIDANHQFYLQTIMKGIDDFYYVWEKDPTKEPVYLSSMLARVSHAIRDKLNSDINTLIVTSNKLHTIHSICKGTYSDEKIEEVKKSFVDLNIQLNINITEKMVSQGIYSQILNNPLQNLLPVIKGILQRLAFYESIKKGTDDPAPPEQFTANQLYELTKQKSHDLSPKSFSLQEPAALFLQEQNRKLKELKLIQEQFFSWTIQNLDPTSRIWARQMYENLRKKQEEILLDIDRAVQIVEERTNKSPISVRDLL